MFIQLNSHTIEKLEKAFVNDQDILNYSSIQRAVVVMA